MSQLDAISHTWPSVVPQWLYWFKSRLPALYVEQYIHDDSFCQSPKYFKLLYRLKTNSASVQLYMQHLHIHLPSTFSVNVIDKCISGFSWLQLVWHLLIRPEEHPFPHPATQPYLDPVCWTATPMTVFNPVAYLMLLRWEAFSSPPLKQEVPAAVW